MTHQTEAYKAASHLASVTPPPVMLSRGIGWQDCDRENVELLGSNRIGNRKVIEVSASFMIFFSMLGKFGALFASIPFPMFVAIYYVLFGIVGLSILEYFREYTIRVFHGFAVQ